MTPSHPLKALKVKLQALVPWPTEIQPLLAEASVTAAEVPATLLRYDVMLEPSAIPPNLSSVERVTEGHPVPPPDVLTAPLSEQTLFAPLFLNAVIKSPLKLQLADVGPQYDTELAKLFAFVVIVPIKKPDAKLPVPNVTPEAVRRPVLPAAVN